MHFYSSEIVADARNIELELHHSTQERREYLRDWFNNQVLSGGLGELQTLPDDVPEDWAARAIECHVGRPVILGEVLV